MRPLQYDEREQDLFAVGVDQRAEVAFAGVRVRVGK
jgi:hypothetical protein